MNTPRLLNKEKKLYCGRLDGMSYIKDSQKRSANLNFYTSCVVNTENNSAIVKYKVEAFDKSNSDYDVFTTTNYSEAINKYNELAVKWNGHRFN
jgi:predicted secreted Zn-dependent protease